LSAPADSLQIALPSVGTGLRKAAGIGIGRPAPIGLPRAAGIGIGRPAPIGLPRPPGIHLPRDPVFRLRPGS